MARILSDVTELQILNKEIKPVFIITINGVDYSNYLVSSQLAANSSYGAQSGQFTLINTDEIFSDGGSQALHVGDEVAFYETFAGSGYNFKKFRGFIENRSVQKSASTLVMTISCLDYISVLQNTDIKLQLEADKIEVTNELLVPNYFTSEGNEMFSQVFNFANNAIAPSPVPILSIRDKNAKTDDLDYQGFEILSSVGQVKFGAPLNALNNYDVLAKSYYFYPRGLYVEDCMEEVIKAELGYTDTYLFGETSSVDVVNNHLRTSYVAEDGLDELGNPTSYLVPNYTTQTTYVFAELQTDYNPTQLVTTTLAQDFDYNADTVLYLNDTTGFEEPGSGETYKEITVRGFTMTYTGVGSGNTLTGVSGSYYIKSGATVTYDTGVAVTTIEVDSTAGLPSSGSAEISGDTFTWTSIDATHLYGVPTSGENSLSSHAASSYVKYTYTCPAGRAWYLPYNNITSTLTSGNFTLPSGSTIDYIDHKFGRIIIDSEISVNSTLTCDVDFNFKTLQSTGIEINKIDFLERTSKNRFEAIKQLRSFLAPNYILLTRGEDKVYGRYMNQKLTQDYNLTIVSDYSFLEDSDIYTRVLMFGKNKNPLNIMFNEGVEFITTGESYKSLATGDELLYTGTENGWHNFETYISRAGYITAETEPPTVYINNVKVDNTPHQVVAQPVAISQTTKTTTTTKTSKGHSEVSTKSRYYYKVTFAHQSLYSSEPIYLYDSSGVLQYTISPNSEEVDYSRGEWNVPGNEENAIVEDLSTATYSIFYADSQIKIDYDNVIFSIKETMIPEPERVIVLADYEYIHTMTPINGIDKVYDGRWDTQCQTEFFSSPPTGYNYAKLDLGQVYVVQGVDLVGGFYKPDEVRKFDISFKATLWYSLDDITYYRVSEDSTNFEVQGGTSVSFDGESLAPDGNLSARYFKITLENVAKIDYGKTGVWPVALTEIAIYSEVTLRSEAKLIPISYLTSAVTSGDTVIPVDSTKDMTDPGSGETVTAYINGNSFTYTGLTDTSFTGVSIDSGESYTTGTVISKSVREDPDIYDFKQLHYYQSDRVFKFDRTSNGFLYSQDELDAISKAFLEEYVKQTTAVQVSTIFVPFLNIGDSVYLPETDKVYFVSAIQSNGVGYTLTLNYYPSV